MVLAVMIVALVAICIMGYLYMRSIEAIVRTINMYPEVAQQEPEVLPQQGELRALPTIRQDSAVMPTDFELWYQEQESLRLTDPESPLIDSEWDRHSAERMALSGGNEW